MGMNQRCALRRKDEPHDGKLIGPFDWPPDAVAYAMSELGLDASKFIIEPLHAPRDREPFLRVVPNDAA